MVDIPSSSSVAGGGYKDITPSVLVDLSGQPYVASGGGGGGGTTLSGTATVTPVAASTSVVTLKASDSAQLGATVYYDGAAILYLLEGAGTPSATNFTTKLGAGYFTQYDAPSGFIGALKGIWSAATGSAYVTKRTA